MSLSNRIDSVDGFTLMAITHMALEGGQRKNQFICSSFIVNSGTGAKYTFISAISGNSAQESQP